MLAAENVVRTLQPETLEVHAARFHRERVAGPGGLGLAFQRQDEFTREDQSAHGERMRVRLGGGVGRAVAAGDV